MDDDLFLINDIEKEYKKLSQEMKKKYPKLKELVDFSLKTIEKIKSTVISPTSYSNISQVKKQFESELQLSMNIIIKPIIDISENNKYSKFNLSCVLILKKLITYNYITEGQYNIIIKVLKEMYDNSNEDTQLKILETLQSLISINVSKISEETLNNIMIIFCRIFCFKNIETKNALQLILGTFMKKIFDYCDDKIIINLLKNLVLLSDGKKPDWISTPTINGKCLGLELITIIIETFPDKINNDNYKSVFIDIKNMLKIIYSSNIDHQIMGIKSCRLILVIINKLNILYDLIEGPLKFIEKSNQIVWQKMLGLEILSELFKNKEFLFGLYKQNKILYEKMLINFTDITYQTFMLKKKNSNNENTEMSGTGSGMNLPLLRKQSDPILKIPNKKYLSNNLIIFDEHVIITQNINYVYKLITECFGNIKNSFVGLLEENNISVNVHTLDQKKKEQKSSSKNLLIENENMNQTQKDLKEMICTQFVNIKGSLIGIFINFNDLTKSQTFISIMQTFIYIFSSFDLISFRDELLNDLCKLAIPNNLENISEVKDKNILIIRAIFNLIHCINLLDYSSWLILIETIQNIYFILIKSSSYIHKYKDIFNIYIIVNDLIENIKKYSYSTDLKDIDKMIEKKENIESAFSILTLLPELNVNNKEHKQKNKSVLTTSNNYNLNIKEIKEKLTEEQKENIEILSNAVNTLFIESNTYDNETLKIIIKALYDNIKKIFDNYIKEKLESKKIIKENNTNTNDKNNENNNNKVMSISSTNLEYNKKDSNNQNVGNNNNQPQTNNNNNIGRFQQLNGVFSAAQTKIMNNINYVLGITNYNNNNNYTNMVNTNINNANINISNNNNIVNINNASIQNEKLLANLAYINFNLIKILCLAIININRVPLFWDTIIETVTFLCSNSMNNRFSNILSKFTIEILVQIIIEILLQYKHNNNENKIFSNNEIQITIFKPIFSFLNRYHNISFVLEPLQKILEKCSIKLNVLGWNSFINILNQILSNEKVDSQQCESVFKLVEQIFNEYSIYLNIFNIEPILNILEIFSVSKDNNNICYSSISYFWQCANICEDYQKEKRKISSQEMQLFEGKIKYNNEEEKNEYLSKIWKDIFFKLININNDERFEIRKSGINVFSQIYVAKLKLMNILLDNNKKISAEIIYELFFEIMNKNIKNYFNNQEKFEDTIVLTLQSIGKIIKCFFEENKGTDCYEENNNIFSVFINKCLDLMKKNTPLISSSILKNIVDLEFIEEKLFTENLSSNWKIFDEIGKFIENENLFINNYSKTIDGEKLIEIIVEVLRNIFIKLISIKDMDINLKLNKEIEKLIIYSPKIFNVLNYTEYNFIKANPKVLINTENYLFELIEILGKEVKNNDTLIIIMNYLISFISFDLKNPHSEILCKRSIECIENIFNNNEYIHLISNEEIAKIILNIVNMIIPILKKRDDIKIIQHIIKFHKKDNKYLFNFLIDKLLYNIFDPIFFDIKDPIIIDKLIILFNELLNKENKTENIDINEQCKHELIKINEDLEISTINYIINYLFIKSFFIKEDLRDKILSIILYDKSESKIIYKSFSPNNFNIKSLFEICKIESKEEIKNKFNKILNENKNMENISNYIEQYIEIRIKIAKISIPLLIKKCKEEMKIYLNKVNQKKLIDINDEDKIKYILNNLKELNYILNEEDEKLYENHIMKECLKSKKGHLFILHFILTEFIHLTNNVDIINIIKDIFKIISDELGIKNND